MSKGNRSVKALGQAPALAMILAAFSA